MRAARNSEVIRNNNKLVGFNLGADYCAEHEWGISKILNTFNVNENKIGIEGRIINEVPKSLVFTPVICNKIQCYLLVLLPFSYYYFNDTQITEKDLRNFELTIYNLEEIGISTAWDERSFAILVTDKYKTDLEELYKAFINLDIAIGIYGTKVFQNGGLTFCIKSNLPENVIQELKDKDLDYIALQKAAKKTKIEKILKRAGKKYFALSPRWKDDNKKEVIFWLNPYHQDVDNFGWFTVQDLKDWAKGIGKIPKK